MPFDDLRLNCVECSNPFVYTALEQQFHAEKGFTNVPKRCRICRQVRRSARGEGQAVGTGAPQTPVGEAGGGARTEAVDGPPPAARATPSTFSAVCSACKGEALLPFEPTGNRAVLCGACTTKIYAPAGRA